MNLHPELGIQPRGNEIKDNCSLWDFYGHNHDGLTHDLSLFDHINLENFYNETYSAFLMISCKYKKDDCTKWWKVRVKLQALPKSYSGRLHFMEIVKFSISQRCRIKRRFRQMGFALYRWYWPITRVTGHTAGTHSWMDFQFFTIQKERLFSTPCEGKSP